MAPLFNLFKLDGTFASVCLLNTGAVAEENAAVDPLYLFLPPFVGAQVFAVI